MTEPTENQEQQAIIAQTEAAEIAGRLIAEGMDVRIVATALMSAATGLLADAYGFEKVPAWLQAHANVARAIASPD